MEANGFAHGVLIILIGCVQLRYGDDASEWRSGPPDGLPKLTSFDVECQKEDMIIHLEFNTPYDGSVYSKGAGTDKKCVHVPPRSHVTDATFTIHYGACGTRSDSHGKFYENTIILQYDDDVLEAWDEAKKIRCEWHDGYEKSAYKTPITISDLDVVEMNFQGDDIDCWLEIQDGKGPWSSKVSGLVPLGSPLTLVVAIQDEEGHFDMRVKECKAHDGNRHPVYLTDEEGCVLRPKMMSPFRKTKDPKDGATVVAYSHFYAFKFPDTVDVHVQCTVEICRHGCSQECTQSRNASPQGSSRPPIIVARPNDEDPDDIPTYRDSYPHLTSVEKNPSNATDANTYFTRHGIDINGTKGYDEAQDIAEPQKDHIAPEETTFIFPNFMRHTKPEDLLDVFQDRHDVNPPDYISLTDKYHDYSPVTHGPDYYEDIDLFKEVFGDGKGFHIIHANEKFADERNATHEAALTGNETLNNEQIPIIPNLTYDNMNQNDQFEKRVSILEHNDTVMNNQPGGTVDSHNSSHNRNEAEKDKVIEISHVTSGDKTDLQPMSETSDANEHKNYVSQNGDQATSEVDDVPSKYVPNYTEKLSDILNAEGSTKDPEISDYYEDTPDYEHDLQQDNEKGFQKHVQNTEYDYYVEKYPNQARKQHTKFDNRNRNVIDYSTLHRSYRPPVPVAPLTLYNGRPLHHYRQKAHFLDGDKYRYFMHSPLPAQHGRSNNPPASFRMGKRRKRREIGDKEQLGLQQTFQVIAPSDLAFIDKDDDTSHYFGKQYDYEVCMASTSFAAGLGLMVLANVCVLCVVAFFSHHYCMNHRAYCREREKKPVAVEETHTNLKPLPSRHVTASRYSRLRTM